MSRGEMYLAKPGTVQADMDSAMAIANRMEQLSRHRNTALGQGLSKLLRARTMVQSGHPQDARIIAQQAVSIFEKLNTPREKADALIELGGTYNNTDEDIPAKISCYQQGIDIYHRLGDKMKEASMLEVLGDINQVKQDYNAALSHLHQALTIYQSIGYKKLQGVYALLGSVHNEKSNYIEALRYNLLAVKTGEELGDSGMLMSTVYNRLAMSYYNIDYTRQSMEYYRKGMYLARINKDPNAIQNFLFNIGELLGKMGRYEEALDSLNAAYTQFPVADANDEGFFMMRFIRMYLQLNDHQQAEKCYRKMLGIYGQVNELMRQELRLSLSTYLVKKGRFAEAAPYLDTFAVMEQTYPSSVLRNASIAQLQYKTDSALGNLSAAIAHMVRHKTLSDSARNLAQSRQLGQLQLQFETDQKDKDIKLLVQRNELQEASLQKERVIRYVIIAGVIILIAFLGLIYSRYRNKKRTNIQLEKQQNEINAQNDMLKGLLDEKEWLLKEIHHRVKNNLQIIISLLNTQSQYLNNKDALAAIRNSQQRMYSMSLIHQRLYQTDNLGKIDMHWYIPEMIGYMKDSFETDRRITFHLACAPIELDVAQAVPVGLILNEAVSNAIKYAFPGGRKGHIDIQLMQTTEDCCELVIADNGAGIPPGMDAMATASLGMSLMQGLSMQLDGQFELTDNHPGVRISLAFRYQNFASTDRLPTFAEEAS
ncbi:tetratricopeptide repeat-containing sensor histidine kinase [Chitinophaga rhizophila]|nr:histidine kinase dimerization/phosphoacceptor domain -containing protein [Chitinophaga rhizophila]